MSNLTQTGKQTGKQSDTQANKQSIETIREVERNSTMDEYKATELFITLLSRGCIVNSDSKFVFTPYQWKYLMDRMILVEINFDKIVFSLGPPDAAMEHNKEENNNCNCVIL